MDIPTDEFTNLSGRIHKYLLESDGKFTLSILKDYIDTYINISSREDQDDAMLFKAIINSLSSDGKCKIYNWSEDFHTLGKGSGVLLIKTILKKIGLQTHAIVMK